MITVQQATVRAAGRRTCSANSCNPCTSLATSHDDALLATGCAARRNSWTCRTPLLLALLPTPNTPRPPVLLVLLLLAAGEGICCVEGDAVAIAAACQC